MTVGGLLISRLANPLPAQSRYWATARAAIGLGRTKIESIFILELLDGYLSLGGGFFNLFLSHYELI